MHESIAKAILKGHKRLVQSAMDDFIPRYKSVSKSRGTFIKKTTEAIKSIPGVFIVEEGRDGQGKNLFQYFLSMVLSRDSEAPGWIVYLIALNARNFKILSKPLGIRATNHVVERMMTRLNITQPQDTFPGLVRSFYYLTSDLPKNNSEMLLISYGGAVIAKPDNQIDGYWALVSFIDADKLRPEQLQELVERDLGLSRILQKLDNENK